MKNEKPYLKEWLEYHLLQGVEQFYLCDNGSTDGTDAYLEPYVAKGVITYIPLPGVDKQAECYEKSLPGTAGKQSGWLLLIWTSFWCRCKAAIWRIFCTGLPKRMKSACIG